MFHKGNEIPQYDESMVMYLIKRLNFTKVHKFELKAWFFPWWWTTNFINVMYFIKVDEIDHCGESFQYYEIPFSDKLHQGGGGGSFFEMNRFYLNICFPQSVFVLSRWNFINCFALLSLRWPISSKKWFSIRWWVWWISSRH